jgi:signal transduction histidine kinase
MWITAFVLIMLWQYVIAVIFFDQINSVDSSTGLAMTILFGAMCFLVGQIVCIRRQAEQANAHNQRLLADLQVAQRQLQDRAAQLEELAVMHERSRLARELHDSVTQTVFSMTLAVQTAQVLLTKDVSRVAAHSIGWWSWRSMLRTRFRPSSGSCARPRSPKQVCRRRCRLIWQNGRRATV